MATLRLPLSITSSGILELSGATDPIVRDRIRIFLLSGAGEYARVPSRGIRDFWAHLFTTGSSGGLRSAMEEKTRRAMEKTVLNDINEWLQGIDTVEDVAVLGDEHYPNGIRFTTESESIMFTFLLSITTALPGTEIGPFTVIEEFNANR